MACQCGVFRQLLYQRGEARIEIVDGTRLSEQIGYMQGDYG